MELLLGICVVTLTIEVWSPRHKQSMMTWSISHGRSMKLPWFYFWSQSLAISWGDAMYAWYQVQSIHTVLYPDSSIIISCWTFHLDGSSCSIRFKIIPHSLATLICLLALALTLTLTNDMPRRRDLDAENSCDTRGQSGGHFPVRDGRAKSSARTGSADMLQEHAEDIAEVMQVPDLSVA